MSTSSTVLAAALAAVMTTGCTKPETAPIETGAGSTTAARKFLEGRWALESFEVMPAGQAPIRVAGQGTLSYDAFGNLDMEVRADEETARMLQRAGIETANGVLSTKGRTVVDMQARTLTFVMEGQSPPAAAPFTAPAGPLALTRKRHWQVDGTLLTLTTQSDDGKPLSVGRWRKQS
jgi:hypothetical protein